MKIGTLCLVSRSPRQFDADDRAALADFARLAELVFEHRALGENQSLLLESLAAAEREKMIDPLSGLWNRRGLEAFLDHELARARRTKSSVALAMIDVDHFKQINDCFGHDAGDRAIQQVASLLVRAVRATDVIARVGGDEFAVLLPDACPELLPTVGTRILNEFRLHGTLAEPGTDVCLEVSVGFASGEHYTGACADSQQLLAQADRALYESKRSGRNRYVIHSI